MSASVSFTNAAALQAYIRTYQNELLGKLFHGFSTGDVITAHEGVKGQKVLTEFILGTMVRRWNKAFAAQDDTLSFNPRTLIVYPAKVDIQIYPQEFEDTYLGMARKPGFQPQDMPFEKYILMRVLEKVAEEKETAIWTGSITGSAATDPLTSLIDGFKKIVADAITATTLTAITTPAHSATNAVANAELVFAGLNPVYQAGKTVMFCSFEFARLYRQDYRTRYGYGLQEKAESGSQRIRLDVGDCTLVPTFGLQGSSRLICTPAENLHYGYDLDSDNGIRIVEDHRSLDLMIDFKFGCQVGILADGVMAVNNLT